MMEPDIFKVYTYASSTLSNVAMFRSPRSPIQTSFTRGPTLVESGLIRFILQTVL